MNGKDQKYISLQEATKYCSYSQEYLSLLARQEKLKAVKFGRNWVTTKEWVGEYLQRIEDNNNKAKVQEERMVSRAAAGEIKIEKKSSEAGQEIPSFASVPDNAERSKNIFSEKPSSVKASSEGLKIKRPVFDFSFSKIRISEKARLAGLVCLVFVLLTAGGIFAFRLTQGDPELVEWVGKESFKNVFQKTNPYVIEINQEVDEGIVEGWKNINEGVHPVRDLIVNIARETSAKISNGVNSAKEISMDISNGVQEIGQAGNTILKGIATSFTESLAQASKDISRLSKNTASTIGKTTSSASSGAGQLTDTFQGIPKSIAGIFQDFGRGLSSQIYSMWQGLGSLAQTASQVFQDIGRGFGQGIAEISSEFGEIRVGIVKIGKTVSTTGSDIVVALWREAGNSVEGIAGGIKGISQGVGYGLGGIGRNKFRILLLQIKKLFLQGIQGSVRNFLAIKRVVKIAVVINKIL